MGSIHHMYFRLILEAKTFILSDRTPPPFPILTSGFPHGNVYFTVNLLLAFRSIFKLRITHNPQWLEISSQRYPSHLTLQRMILSPWNTLKSAMVRYPTFRKPPACRNNSANNEIGTDGYPCYVAIKACCFFLIPFSVSNNVRVLFLM